MERLVSLGSSILSTRPEGVCGGCICEVIIPIRAFTAFGLFCLRAISIDSVMIPIRAFIVFALLCLSAIFIDFVIIPPAKPFA